MVNDGFRLKTRVRIFNISQGNRLEWEGENLITDAGLTQYADRLINDSVPFIDYLGVGDGVGTHAVIDTILFNEIFRNQMTAKSSPLNVAEFTATILGNEALGAWTELGMFNDANVGSMTNVIDTSYTHIVDDELQIIWEVTLERQ